jgi:imidazolonepropionase-like amidohydrolase
MQPIRRNHQCEKVPIKRFDCKPKLLVILSLILVILTACCSPVSPRTPSATSFPTTGAQQITTTPNNSSPIVALVNGTLIDGVVGQPIEDAVLLIQDGFIVGVGQRDSISIPNSAAIIDVQGATILPGLINAHVHAAYNLTKLEEWAQSGVTTVCDLSAHSWPGSLPIRDQANHNPRYAHLAIDGVMITAPGGYPIAQFGGIGLEVSTPEEARQAVLDLIDQGADVVKMALESGEVFGKSFPMLSPEAIQAVVETAHQHGKLVGAHVTVSKDLQIAMDAGVDFAAHMVVDIPTDAQLEQMVRRGMYWIPTLELWKIVAQDVDRNVIDNLGRFVQAGGMVALGTDYAGYTGSFQLGMPMHEMEWMQQAGMSSMQIIVAGTQNAAHVCGLGDQLGTLETGKIADILVVEGDPLKDLHTLLNVQWVIHDGVIIRQPAP